MNDENELKENELKQDEIESHYRPVGNSYLSRDHYKGYREPSQPSMQYSEEVGLYDDRNW